MSGRFRVTMAGIEPFHDGSHDTKTVALHLGVSKSCVFSWVREGKFPKGERWGRCKYWRGADLNAWMEERMQAEAEALKASLAAWREAEAAKARRAIPAGCLDTKGVCRRLGISKQRLWQRIWAGTFPRGQRPGAHRFWTAEEVDAWLEARKAGEARTCRTGVAS